MPLLTHQIVVPDQVTDASDLPPIDNDRAGDIGWHLCPMRLADEQFCVIVNCETAYVESIAGDIDAEAVEEAIMDAILVNEPPGREHECVSIGFEPEHMNWCISSEVPALVAAQLEWLSRTLRSCPDVENADATIAWLNTRPLKVGDFQLRPKEALEKRLEALSADFRDYMHTSTIWQRLWNGITGRRPWLDRWRY